MVSEVLEETIIHNDELLLVMRQPTLFHTMWVLTVRSALHRFMLILSEPYVANSRKY